MGRHTRAVNRINVDNQIGVQAQRNKVHMARGLFGCLGDPHDVIRDTPNIRATF
jgi:hypothetical protein